MYKRKSHLMKQRVRHRLVSTENTAKRKKHEFDKHLYLIDA